jgi:demethylmenaquinone methyltransferase/2-methoxy-6-polyprenyl-1,4-benzoquinol methylase
MRDVNGEPPPDSEEARRRYRRLASGYDRQLGLLVPLRRRIIARLALGPGDHVLDMGCGTGASFPALRSAVGAQGGVTGVDLSEEMAAVARQRVFDAGWDNVEVLEGDATAVTLPADVDGILFFLTHDLTRLPAVVERAVAAGRTGATIVAFGPVRAHGWSAAPVNAIVRAIARSYVTTFEGFEEPWSHIAALVPDLKVRRLLGGGTYLAVGHTPDAIA